MHITCVVMIILFAKSQIKKCDLTNGLGLHPGRPKSLPRERETLYCPNIASGLVFLI